MCGTRSCETNLPQTHATERSLTNHSFLMYSVVLAKLFVSNFSCLEVLSQSQVKGEDRGIRPFVVQLSTGKALKPVVCSR
jgi:hypothetical protein